MTVSAETHEEAAEEALRWCAAMEIPYVVDVVAKETTS